MDQRTYIFKIVEMSRAITLTAILNSLLPNLKCTGYCEKFQDAYLNVCNTNAAWNMNRMAISINLLI